MLFDLEREKKDIVFLFFFMNLTRYSEKTYRLMTLNLVKAGTAGYKNFPGFTQPRLMLILSARSSALLKIRHMYILFHLANAKMLR